MESAALLKRVDELPRLPKAVSELLDAVNNDNSTVKSISAKVAQDPLISARVLRLANSAHFGRSREVGSIDEAVIRLGMQTLRTLVIASAVIGAIPNVDGVDLADFWGETFEEALYAQEMAKRCGVPPDEAFTCAILHNIGDLLIAVVEPKMSANIRLAVQAGGDKQQLETELLGFDSPAVGALLAKTWKFTPSLVQGIQYQRDPLAAKPASKLASVIYLSHQVFRHWDDDRDEESFTAWLAGKANHEAGIIKMDMDGLADRFDELRGKGLEIGKQLA
ncbi:HDOD domain-containing protein [Shewanella sp. SR43-4]|jgi:HD-like signal output (HDOD) protein|uniref:HDOD domain-containing protein n=1 Tax=Shewanella vesiculosa TaxID=518738 RepID=A0ABV0FTR8_9GAMM|nr:MULTISPECIES: HDOD domain-containing protein [Shewanella]MBB1317706.1 HDOD domain-containing protein [Shewanella sp. SR43-4]MBB1322290.1 HDOD domain-containing protein [Shewanella sp. SR43-8]MBB1476027.1 HDOD domain-containing protein [Shewanella sp. SG41-3]RPA46084.1 HDOD domain-containing protein [Shewanella vesiculosa]UJL41731.1 HDOD domain-containing protein [Shewanella vesiculosa]|tara:strand:- start:3142 stop:3975 length:834 start_codon:yes stop_codon:yes gene_type:complete